MARRKGKRNPNNTFGVIVDFAEAVDTVFERVTGKPISSWLKEFQQRPTELPGESAASPQIDMPLVDAYAILGLPQTASLEEVKRNYRSLAAVFHPDRGGYEEAMKLLNKARDRIMQEKGGK